MPSLSLFRQEPKVLQPNFLTGFDRSRVEGLTHQIDAHLSQLVDAEVDEDLTHITRRSRAGLARATDRDSW